MRYPDTTGGPSRVEWQGRRYYLNARRSGGYYYPSGKLAGEAKRPGLHQEIYRAAHGPIPDGWVVHHKDDNSLNNDPANLQAKPRGKHQAEHMAEAYQSPTYRAAVAAQLAETAGPLAAEWHPSEEGRAWHRQHAQEMWSDENRERMLVEFDCEVCGERVTRYQRARTCGQTNCYNRRARKEGRYKITARCAWCDEDFETSKFRPAKACSPRCAANMRWHGTPESAA